MKNAENPVIAAAALRRSVYALGKEAPRSDERIGEIVREALWNAPSPYNSQSARVVLLLGGRHDALWDAVLAAVKPLAKGADAKEATRQKIAGFKAARGTVLFFEDQDTVRSFQETYPLFAQKFADWSLQSSGMLQFQVWTALAAEGIGASLQHYNPLIDEWVAKEFALPASWRLLSQMPFGQILSAPGEKSHQSIEDRFKVFQ